jgi:hypothetical protein
MVAVGDIEAENWAVIVITELLSIKLSASLSVRVTPGAGQVPQTGVLALVRADCELKLSGVDEIPDTHQPERS